MKELIALALAAATAFAFGTGALAADGPPAPHKETVKFAKGASSTTIKATMKGGASVDYVVRAAAGQTLEVRLAATNTQSDFNVLSPGSKDVAMYVSSMTGERSYKGVLPVDGDYTIRVYIDRAAARRNEASNYVLTVGVTGKALPPLPAVQDAKVKGTAYHATATVTCVPPFASAAESCDAGVIRRGRDGTASVVMTGKNKLVRRILFVGGKPTASDAAEAMTATKQGDVTQVKIGEERYDIPDAFLTGG